MQDLFLIGAGGLGRESESWITNSFPSFRVAGFYDENDSHPDAMSLSDIAGNDSYLITIGDPEAKSRIANCLAPLDLEFVSLIHPNVYCGSNDTVHVGPGTVIHAGCSLTTDIIIGQHCLVNLNCTIGHDVRIGDYSSIMPGVHISGNVTIGEGVYIGSGAVIVQGISIGDRVIVGAGAVVTKSIADGEKVKGVPARTF